MGGIAAIVNWDGRPCSPGDISTILSASPYRSPDGATQWLRDAACLGHQRFITTPEQTFDRQPLVDERAAIAFVFDGRLDNRGALIAELCMPDSSTAPDSTLAFEAFKKWGSTAAAHLLGDFAFIAWDWRGRRLTAARDHMGVRPLHFASVSGLLVCATDVSQVLAHAAVPCEPDTTVVADYLACDVRNGPGTLFRGVSRLPPGHVLDATAGGTCLERYWSPEPAVPIRYGSDAEYAAHCRELLVASVDARLRSNRTPAALLSGGLDSSSVVTVSHRLITDRGPGPQPFSMVFPGRPDADERRYIDAVAARCGVTPVFVVPDAVTAADLHGGPRAMSGMPGMLADEMARSLYAAIRARGHRVALTGAAGDFLFSGSVFQYADLLRSGRPIEALRRFLDDRTPDATGWRPLGLLQAGVWPLLPAALKRALRPLARRAIGITDRPEWLRLPRAAVDRLPEAPRAGSYATEEVTRDLGSGLHSFFLETGESVGAQARLELRHPFLDVRLVQFALDIPDEQRKRGLYQKYVLRQALAGDLAHEVGERITKASAGHAVVQALDALGGERFYRDLAIAAAGWVDPEILVRKFRVMHRAFDAADEVYGNHIPSLWMVGAIELWFRAAFAAAPYRRGIMVRFPASESNMTEPAKRPTAEGPDGAFAGQRKRPYSTPRLTEYGSVAKLTQGSRSINSDFPQAGFKKNTCL